MCPFGGSQCPLQIQMSQKWTSTLLCKTNKENWLWDTWKKVGNFKEISRRSLSKFWSILGFFRPVWHEWRIPDKVRKKQCKWFPVRSLSDTQHSGLNENSSSKDRQGGTCKQLWIMMWPRWSVNKIIKQSHDQMIKEKTGVNENSSSEDRRGGTYLQVALNNDAVAVC